jgi:rhodanese-related sulfurtransferase
MVLHALARNSQLILASVVVLLAVMLHSGPSMKARLQTADVSVQEAISLIDSGAIVIDVRQSPKTHLPGAMLIPLEVLGAHLSKLEAAKTQTIVVYCGSGTSRGPEAAQLLTRAGFPHVVNLKSGFEGWRASGRPVVAG